MATVSYGAYVCSVLGLFSTSGGKLGRNLLPIFNITKDTHT